ncbi:hypothetical protein DBR06_SOUSAS101810001, partial [Sousa chinensis]
IQMQKGPKIISPHGLLQPIAEAFKFLIKEPLCPSTSSIYILFP